MLIIKKKNENRKTQWLDFVVEFLWLFVFIWLEVVCDWVYNKNENKKSKRERKIQNKNGWEKRFVFFFLIFIWDI